MMNSRMSEMGIDEAEIATRKAFLSFGSDDTSLLASMHDLLAEDGLIEGFYRHLQNFPEISPLLGDEAKLSRLKRAQHDYFSQLTQGSYGRAYVENRLQVGVAHQRVGLTPKWYMSAYCNYLGGALPLLLERFAADPEQQLAACRALFKIVFFDMGLALDTYFHAEHQALLLAHSYTEQIVSNMPIGFIVLDPSGKIGLANNAVLGMFDLKPDGGWAGKTLGQYFGLGMLDERVSRVLESGKPCSDCEFEREVGGRVRAYHADISPAQMEGGKVVLFMVQDITLRKESEEEIHRLAFYDSLTRLPNRRLLQERLQQSMSMSARSGRYGALMFLDLDNFKTINDTLGHDVGDQLLQEVAARLLQSVREGDTVARLGGDEFVVTLEALSANPHEAAARSETIAEKIRAELGRPYPLAGIEHHSSPSIGVSLYLGHENSLDEILKQADLAMYQAKTGGRNRVCFFDPALQIEMEERAGLEKDLRQSIRRGELRLHYQLQADDSGRIVGAEALIRWLHPVRGMVSPAEFIPLAEEIGMIVPIGGWVIEEACRQLKLWAEEPALRRIQLSVNVSPKQICQPYFVEEVKAAVDNAGVDPARLKFELTESVILSDVEEAIEKMRELSRFGIRFAMDDFGTGYSSLSYLNRLPLEQVKIDQSFIRGITHDRNSRAMVRTIIDISRNFGMKIVAEGVETDDQLAFLRQYGCNLYQGYLFGRPVPAAEFAATVRATPPG